LLHPLLPPPTRSPLFPYTTLFRSNSFISIPRASRSSPALPPPPDADCLKRPAIVPPCGRSAGTNRNPPVAHRRQVSTKFIGNDRSEERRVGKECKHREWTETNKKK